ncbi:hypothetical protein ACLB2K_066053 [Fragaria x ananassa]
MVSSVETSIAEDAWYAVSDLQTLMKIGDSNSETLKDEKWKLICSVWFNCRKKIISSAQYRDTMQLLEAGLDEYISFVTKMKI